MNFMNPLMPDMMGPMDPQMQEQMQRQMYLRAGLAMLAGSGQGNNNASVIGQGLLSGMNQTDQMMQQAMQYKMKKDQMSMTKDAHDRDMQLKKLQMDSLKHEGDAQQKAARILSGDSPSIYPEASFNDAPLHERLLGAAGELAPYNPSLMAGMMKPPDQEKLVQIYDKSSPTGTKFVPESQAVGMPGKAQSGMKLEMGPDGTFSFIQGAGADIAKPTRNDAEEKVISAGESLARLQRIKANYDPAFLTYQGKGKAWYAGIKSKADFELNPEEKQFLSKRRRFTQGVNYEFNAYRKLITGAAAAVKELEDLKKAVINTDLSPAEFEAAYNEYSRELQRTVRIRNQILREGIKPGTKQFGERLDGLYISGGDDTAEARGSELEKLGTPPEQIVNILEQEGYI